MEQAGLLLEAMLPFSTQASMRHELDPGPSVIPVSIPARSRNLRHCGSSKTTSCALTPLPTGNVV